MVEREAAGAGAVDHHFGDGELAGERLALRFPIDGAGEAVGLGVGGLAAGMIGDQLGRGCDCRAPAGRSRRPTGWARVATALGGDRRRILELVEAERFGGERGGRHGRSLRMAGPALVWAAISGCGHAAGRAKAEWQPRSGPRRGKCVALKLKSVRSAGRTGMKTDPLTASRLAWPPGPFRPNGSLRSCA